MVDQRALRRHAASVGFYEVACPSCGGHDPACRNCAGTGHLWSDGPTALNDDGMARHLRLEGERRQTGQSLPAVTREMQPTAPILVVDDSRGARDAMCFILDTEGYRVARAVDGRDAVEQLTHGLSPSLILLDLAMPGMDGFEFRAWQVRDERFAAIPVVAYSGAVDVESAERALGVPALRKPVDTERLLQLVATRALRG